MKSRNVGSYNGRAKLTEEQVRQIRLLHSDGVRISELAGLFRVTTRNIWYIVHIRTWRHVD